MHISLGSALGTHATSLVVRDATVPVQGVSVQGGNVLCQRGIVSGVAALAERSLNDKHPRSLVPFT
jgi:hypothetical protein